MVNAAGELRAGIASHGQELNGAAVIHARDSREGLLGLGEGITSGGPC